MSKFFDDTMQGLLQAIEIEKGNIPLTFCNILDALGYGIVIEKKATI